MAISIDMNSHCEAFMPWQSQPLSLRMKNMDVDMIFKIAAIGIIVAILNQLLIRSGREEQALLTTIAGLVVALMMIITQISDLFTAVKNTFGL